MHSEEQFRALLGMTPASATATLASAQAPLYSDGRLSSNPLHRVNQGALLPVDEYLQASGLRLVALSPEDACFTCTQGKHTALIARQRYALPEENRSVSIYSATCAIDERIFPLLPVQVSADGTPVDYGHSSNSFEFPYDSAALLIDSHHTSSTCAIVASSETARLLKKQLRRAADNVGIWEGAQGAALLTTLSERSALMGLAAWYIDRQNQTQNQRADDHCVGFSAFNASDLPYIFGKAVIVCGSSTIQQALYEVAFECRYTLLTSLAGFGDSPIEMISVTGVECRDLDAFSPLTLDSSVAEARPGSYLHARAMRFARGDSTRVAYNFRDAERESRQ